MKKWIVFAVVVALICGTYVLGYRDGQENITFSGDSRDIQQLKLDMAALRGRVETLEAINVHIRVTDHTGIWFVSGVEQWK